MLTWELYNPSAQSIQRSIRPRQVGIDQRQQMIHGQTHRGIAGLRWIERCHLRAALDDAPPPLLKQANSLIPWKARQEDNRRPDAARNRLESAEHLLQKL